MIKLPQPDGGLSSFLPDLHSSLENLECRFLNCDGAGMATDRITSEKLQEISAWYGSFYDESHVELSITSMVPILEAVLQALLVQSQHDTEDESPNQTKYVRQCVHSIAHAFFALGMIIGDGNEEVEFWKLLRSSEPSVSPLLDFRKSNQFLGELTQRAMAYDPRLDFVLFAVFNEVRKGHPEIGEIKWELIYLLVGFVAVGGGVPKPVVSEANAPGRDSIEISEDEIGPF